MIQSIIITGSHQQDRLDQAFQLISQITAIAAPAISQHPDVLQLEPQPSIGINQIRQLKNKLQLKPFQSQWQVALLLEADKTTPEAQNALLKILEEPPAHASIILETSNHHLLLPTITSRCRLIRLKQSSRYRHHPVAQQLLQQLLGAHPSQAIALAQPFASSLTEAKTLTQTLIELLNHQLDIKPSLPLTLALKSALACQQKLNQNFNHRLVMENLFLKFAQIGQRLKIDFNA